MNKPNEMSVQNFTHLNKKYFESQVRSKSKMHDLLQNNQSLKDLNEVKSEFKFLTEGISLITKHKLKPTDLVGLGFVPSLKKMKKDKLLVPKLGGVPSSLFFNMRNGLPKKDSEVFKELHRIWPKSPEGEYLRFIGDIDSTSPTKFLNKIMPKFKCEYRGEEYDYFDSFKYGYARSTFGSLFVSQNFGLPTFKPDGVFQSLSHYDREDKYENEERYIKLVTEFMKQVVNKEDSYSVEEYNLQEITDWNILIEHKEISNSKYTFKLFGYPESQQETFNLYCVNGAWGPRKMNSFLTFIGNEHDNIIQIYADLLSFNDESENRTMYIKTDISST